MRIAFSAIFTVLIAALIYCAVKAWHSHKPIGKAVAMLDISFIPPVVGNLIIIGSHYRMISIVGSYIYFIGMDLVMFALVRFTAHYCRDGIKLRKIPLIVDVLLAADVIQFALNPVFGQAFDLERIEFDGSPYYRLIPYMGQYFHRIVDYGIVALILLTYIIVIKKMPRIYTERYLIIVIAIVIVTVWESLYIFSRSPIDRSMIGFGVFGILVFYFSLYYRPLRLLDRMLSNVVSEMPEALYIFDLNANCLWANARGCELAGIEDEEYDQITEKLLALFGDPGTPEDVNSTQRVVGKGKEARYYSIRESQAFDDRGAPTGSYLRILDITEEQQKMKREMFDATHDGMTGLYTREYLYTRIAEMIDADPGTQYLIIYVDVKNFKVVNDIFGAEFGDYAICCISDWVRKGRSERCRYGRLVGDTFGICMPKDEFDPEQMEEELSHFVVKNEKAEHRLLIHLGVYAIEHEPDKDVRTGFDISVMFDRAHISLAAIRDEFSTHIAYYDNAIRQKILLDQSIASELPDALETRQLCPYFQPIADVDGRIVGAEALARWIHPERGFMPPSDFIPLFEKNGQIVDLDKHMWRCSCEVLADWQKCGRDMFISVNISPKDFYFVDVVSEIKSLVKEYGIEPSKLRIEITETVMMNDVENRMQILDEFRKSGFVVEMDDFGSGYSSLNMLKDMPVDVLKIDMKFLGKADDMNRAKTIVRNIINLSKELGITALTEGVETKTQYAALAEMGCKLFQGYYFAKPMPIDDFNKFADEHAKKHQ